jgi:cell division protein FtsL
MLAARHGQSACPVLIPEHWGPEGREAIRRRRRQYPMIAALAIAALAILPLVAYVATVSNAAHIGYHILQDTQDIAALQTDHERLQAIASSLRAPARIERLATTRLGLRPPSANQIATLPLPERAAVETPGSVGVSHRLGAYLHENEAAAARLTR